jgi:hypothetical protein
VKLQLGQPQPPELRLRAAAASLSRGPGPGPGRVGRPGPGLGRADRAPGPDSPTWTMARDTVTHGQFEVNLKFKLPAESRWPGPLSEAEVPCRT